MTNMKIGIVTCHRVPNHGSYLQAWSLSHYLKREGYDVEIVDYIYPNLYHFRKVYDKEDGGEKRISSIFDRIHRYVVDRWYRASSKRGLEYFIYSFLAKFVFHNSTKCYFLELPLSKRTYHNDKQLKKAANDYDILIVGSDQIWNPRFSGYDRTFFLQFGGLQTKRISYSASFGVSELADQYKKDYKNWLSTFSSIATREEVGARIVKQLLGKPGVHVLDPVMLFSSQQWEAIIPQSNQKQPYVLSYCLDYVYKVYPFVDEILSSLSSKLDLHMVSLYKSELSECDIFNNIHPFEFVRFIKNADFTLVTSFHGLAYSILFHIPFLVVRPKEQVNDSRIYDLLDTFGLGDRVINVGEEITDLHLKEINWKEVDRKYNEMLDISKNYLRVSINKNK